MIDDELVALEPARLEPPEYLISDIIMRGMTGIKLAILGQRELPSCKVLLFSGQLAAPEMPRDAREAGHDLKFLQKPIHPTELIAVLRSL